MITTTQIFNFYNQKLAKYNCDFFVSKTGSGDDRIVILGGNLEIEIEIIKNNKEDISSYIIYIHNWDIGKFKQWVFLDDESFLKGLNKIEEEIINSIL